MNYDVISGVASHVDRYSGVTYVASRASDSLQPGKIRVLNFRLGDRAVLFKAQSFPKVSEGDKISVVGNTRQNGVFQAIALRNDTMGVDYCPPAVGTGVLAWTLIIAGIPAILMFGLGLVMIGWGVVIVMNVGSPRYFECFARRARRRRGLLGMRQDELSDRSRVGRRTLRHFENGEHQANPSILDALRRALDVAGVGFIPENGGGAGVRLYKTPVEPDAE